MLLTRILLIHVLVTGAGFSQTPFLVDGNFDDLRVGQAPDDGMPAGAWQIPDNYVKAGEGEGLLTDIFSIVPTNTISERRIGNSLRIATASSGGHFVSNLFGRPLHEFILSFETYIPRGGGNAGILFAGDHGAGGNSTSEYGPLLYFSGSGELFARERNETVKLGQFATDQWLALEIHMNFFVRLFDVYSIDDLGNRNLVAHDVQFREADTGTVQFLDRITLASLGDSFGLGPSLQYFDNFRFVDLQPAPTSLSYSRVAMIDNVADDDPPAELRFTEFSRPSINGRGEVFFVATALNKQGLSFRGIWQWIEGELSCSVKHGDQLPKSSIEFSISNSTQFIPDVGKLSFFPFLSGPGVNAMNDRAIFSLEDDSYRIIFREGDQAPGFQSGVVHSFPANSRNYAFANGFTAILYGLSGPGISADNDIALWRSSENELTLVAQRGAQVPGFSEGTLFGGFGLNLGDLYVNASGDMVFPASITGPGISINNDSTLWLFRDETLQFIGREGQPAPGGNGSFAHFAREPSINGNGNIVFLNGTPTVAGIYTNASSASLRLVVRRGTAAPGGGVYSVFDDPAIGSNDHIVFSAGLSGPTNGVFAGLPFASQLESIAREGEPYPESEESIVFGDFFLGIHINGTGQVVFTAEYEGALAPLFFNRGIVGTSRDGELKLVARAGNLFETSDDPAKSDIRRIKTALLEKGKNAGQDGRPSCMDDSGRVSMLLSFTDGSEGIFLASLDPVLIGDVNRDGLVNLLDVQGFIEMISNGTYQFEADVNSDGSVNLLDVTGFVKLLT